ncbi:MAG: zinc ribbon domain-containing protein [Prochloraceae cyanobacterium]|nr:zinc ribbon domain-containing protein [Prochloraceae cyanobacterium]
MPECPKCHQKVQFTDITCKYCRTELKAFGHPGIPLHRAEGETLLCDTCTYDRDDTCTYPQRPYAKTCTMYQNYLDVDNNDLDPPVYKTPGGIKGLQIWCQRNPGLITLLALIGISFIIVLLR